MVRGICTRRPSIAGFRKGEDYSVFMNSVLRETVTALTHIHVYFRRTLMGLGKFFKGKPILLSRVKNN